MFENVSRARTIAFSPDDQLGVILRGGLHIVVFDANSGEILNSFEGLESSAGLDDDINQVDFGPMSADGGYTLVAASDDGLVRIWDAENGALVREFDLHNGPVNSVVSTRLTALYFPVG